MAFHGSFNKMWKPVLFSASAIVVVVAVAAVFLLWHLAIQSRSCVEGPGRREYEQGANECFSRHLFFATGLRARTRHVSAQSANRNAAADCH
jgi:hypothetical protein